MKKIYAHGMLKAECVTCEHDHEISELRAEVKRLKEKLIVEDDRLGGINAMNEKRIAELEKENERLKKALHSSDQKQQRSIMKFRKKPVVIEAVQLTKETFDDPHPNENHVPGVIYNPFARCAFIRTLEGEMRADIGDWIIKGVKGELYPCKPDIFEATYERVS